MASLSYLSYELRYNMLGGPEGYSYDTLPFWAIRSGACHCCNDVAPLANYSFRGGDTKSKGWICVILSAESVLCMISLVAP